MYRRKQVQLQELGNEICNSKRKWMEWSIKIKKHSIIVVTLKYKLILALVKVLDCFDF